MKRELVIVVMVAVLLCVGVSISFAQPKGETVTIKGEVIDLWCYLEGGDHGAEHKECAIACANAGNPIGILTEAGEVYVAMGMQDHQPGRDVLLTKMAEVVTVQGTLAKKGGIQAIYISSVE